MKPLLVAVALSVVSSIAYALAAVTQERLAATANRAVPRLLQPRFMIAVALNAVGGGLHVVALRYTSLAVVQPLGALTLVFALPLGAAIGGHRVSRRDWRGAAAVIVGLTGVTLAADTGMPTDALRDHEILLLAAVTLALLAALILTPTGSTRARGLRLATASGIAFGVSSVLTQTLLLRITVRSMNELRTPIGIGTAVTITTLIAAGLLLSQAAYRTGLGATLATLTIVNPITAASIGLVLLGQGAALTPGAAALSVLAAILASRGIVLLATPDQAPRELPAEPARHPSNRQLDMPAPDRVAATRAAHRRNRPNRAPSGQAGPMFNRPPTGSPTRDEHIPDRRGNLRARHSSARSGDSEP